MQPLIPSTIPNTMPWPASRRRTHKRVINLAAMAGLAALLVVALAAPVLAESDATSEIVVHEDLSVGEAPDAKTLSALTQGPEKRGWAWAEPYFTIPVMTSAAGQFGAYFKTRVTLLNPTNRNFTINATLYGPIGRVKRISIPIKAGQTLVWNDFLAEAFTYSGAGGVFFDGWFSPPGGSIDNLFLVTAEVYTDSPNGRYKTVVGNGRSGTGLKRTIRLTTLGSQSVLRSAPTLALSTTPTKQSPSSPRYSTPMGSWLRLLPSRCRKTPGIRNL